MLRYLEALSPSRCCFTASDFDDTLIDIESILKEFTHRKNGQHPHFNHKEKISFLERAYRLSLICLSFSGKRKPDKQLSFWFAEILRHYGQLCFEESFLASKEILLAAFNMHLYSIGVIDHCIDMQEFGSLGELKAKVRAQPHLFVLMERLVLNTHIEQCIARLRISTLAKANSLKRMYSLAETARWLGHAYQNIDSYKALQPENDLRFAQLFNLSEALLLLIDSEESRRELGDLYYQAWPFMYQREHPHDIEGMCALYDRALACDSSKEMLMRVNNMRFLTLYKAGRKTEALSFILQALESTKELADTEHNRFLIANVHYNYSGYLMDPEFIDLEEAEKHLSIAIHYAAKTRAKEEDHLYFAIYDLRLAELKMLLGEFIQAKEAIERGLTSLKKFTENQHMLLGKAEALKSLINKTLAMSHG